MKNLTLLSSLIFSAFVSADPGVNLLGNIYEVDQDGVLIMTEAEFRDVSSNSSVDVVDVAVNEQVSLPKSDLKFLLSEDHLTTSLYTGTDSDGYSFLLKEGSFIGNVNRLAQDAGWDPVIWNVDSYFDFYIKSNELITADSKINVLKAFAMRYPVDILLDVNRTANKTIVRVLPSNGKPKTWSFMVEEGSLKKNLLRLSKDAGWKEPVWQSSMDIHINERYAINADSAESVLSVLFEKYPFDIGS